jgi:diacylglycerol kinase (ATP)
MRRFRRQAEFTEAEDIESMTESRECLENAACIINPNAAQRKWLRRSRIKNFLARNLPGQKFDSIGDKENTIALARRLAAIHPAIVVLGGDGTIADVMQGIREARREKEVTLGIVPLGSGNAFRKSLAIPKNVRRAVRILCEGEPRLLNLMEIEGYISGFSSIGASALVTDAKLRHTVEGFWGHVLSGAALINIPLWEVEAEMEDGLDDLGRPFEKKTVSLRVLDVVVAKSNYFGYSFRIAPLASLSDDYLDITFFDMSGPRYAALLPLTYFGLSQRRFQHFKAKRLILHGKDLPVQYHGEFLGIRDRVEVRVVPQAIRVITPPLRPDRDAS